MNDNELHDRLRSLGTRPVDAATESDHRRRIEAVEPGRASDGRRRFGVVAVAAAGVVGFLAGSTGLAMAGALPDPAQGVAHDVLGVVNVDVPAGKQDKRGPCVAEAAKLTDEAAKQAAKDACPKGPPGGDLPGPDDPDGDGPGRSGDAPGRSGDQPGKSGDAPGRSGDQPGKSGDAPSGKANGTTKHDDDPCRGRPDWAGQMTPEEREAAKAAGSREGCVDDPDDPDELDELDELDDDDPDDG